MTTAQLIVLLGETWLWIGAAVALIFLTIGIDRVDADARGAYVFRPLLIPAVLLIWPLVLWRWWQIERRGEVTLTRFSPVRRSHGAAAVAMTVAVALLLGLSLTARQDWPSGAAPVQLTQGDSE